MADAALAIVALVVGAGCGGSAGRASTDAGAGSAWSAHRTAGVHSPDAGAGPSVRLLTYNVNYGLAGDRESIEAIAEAEADVVLLQETTEAWAHALRDAFGETYPYMSFRDCCGAGGLGVLSRHPFAEKDYAQARGAWFPAWRLVLDSPIGPLQVLNVHLHPQVSEGGSVLSGIFTTSSTRKGEIIEYYDRLDPMLPTLIAGDFNESRAGAAIEYLADRGYRSALESAGLLLPTWRWQTSLGPIHAELDHIVYDERLALLDVRVIPKGRSDHFPVLGVFGTRARAVPFGGGRSDSP